jgi:hypothetical protein
MARTNFTPINEAFTSLINTIAQVHSDLLAKANAERKEALALYARMQETHADLVELNSMIGNAAAALNEIDGVAADIGAKVFDVLVDGFEKLPVCDYEDFVGFCDGCGEEVTYDEAYVQVDDELYHKGCEPIEDEADEDETAVETDAE